MRSAMPRKLLAFMVRHPRGHDADNVSLGPVPAGGCMEGIGGGGLTPAAGEGWFCPRPHLDRYRLAREVARRQVALWLQLQRWLDLGAYRLGDRATGAEAASRGRID